MQSCDRGWHMTIMWWGSKKHMFSADQTKAKIGKGKHRANPDVGNNKQSQVEIKMNLWIENRQSKWCWDKHRLKEEGGIQRLAQGSQKSLTSENWRLREWLPIQEARLGNAASWKCHSSYLLSLIVPHGMVCLPVSYVQMAYGSDTNLLDRLCLLVQSKIAEVFTLIFLNIEVKLHKN